MGARAYSPAHGRFLTVDPVEGGCANDYVYVHGDPVNASDVSRRDAWDWLIGIGLGIGTAIFGTACAASAGLVCVAAGAFIGAQLLKAGYDAKLHTPCRDIVGFIIEVGLIGGTLVLGGVAGKAAQKVASSTGMSASNALKWQAAVDFWVGQHAQELGGVIVDVLYEPKNGKGC